MGLLTITTIHIYKLFKTKPENLRGASPADFYLSWLSADCKKRKATSAISKRGIYKNICFPEIPKMEIQSLAVLFFTQSVAIGTQLKK
jgi:hypothetical protein